MRGLCRPAHASRYGGIMETSSVGGAASLSELLRVLSQNSRTCVVHVSDGARSGQLRVEHGEVVDICFGKLHGPSAMLALMKAGALRHEVVDAPLASGASEVAQGESAAAADGLEAIDVASAEELTDEEVEAGMAKRRRRAVDGSSSADAVAPAPAVVSSEDGAPLLAAGAGEGDAEAPTAEEDGSEVEALQVDDGELEVAASEDSERPSVELQVDDAALEVLAENVSPAADEEVEDDGLARLGDMVAETLEELEVSGFSAEPFHDPQLSSPAAHESSEAALEDEEVAAAIAALELGPEMATEQVQPPLGPALELEHDHVNDAVAPPRVELAPTLHTPVVARRSEWPVVPRSTSPVFFVAAVVLGVCAPILLAILLWRPAGEREASATAGESAASVTASTASGATPSAVEAPASAAEGQAGDQAGATGAAAGGPEADKTALTASAAQPASPAAGATPSVNGAAERAPEWLEGATALAPKGGFVPTVLLRVLVGADGEVRKAEVASPRSALASLERQAIETVQSHRFRPALQGGQAVQAWTTYPLAFVSAPAERGLVIKGSDTIGAALGPAWAQALEKAQPGLHIRVEMLGSKAGLASLFDGSADLALSSRPILDDELTLASKLGLQLREVILGYDGIAVVVHPDNPLRELDLETVARIFTQEVNAWSELAGGDAPIHAFGRPSYSGTRAAFQQRVLAGRAPDAAFGPTVETVESSREVVARVAGDVGAIGYVSVGHVQSSVRPLALRASRAAPAVAVSAASIRDGSYPLARPLLLYLRGDSTRDARAFADFARSSEGQALLERHGFVSAPATSTALRDEPSASVPKPQPLRIYFQSGGTSVVANEWSELSALATALRDGRRAVVVGNTDSTGDPVVNRRIAERRAEVVVNMLRAYGSGDAPIELTAAGSDYPLATNATLEGKSLNRRVDLYILPR